MGLDDDDLDTSKSGITRHDNPRLIIVGIQVSLCVYSAKGR